MKFLLLIFILSVGVEALAVETMTECPMMRESNSRGNLKSVKLNQSKIAGRKNRTSAQ